MREHFTSISDQYYHVKLTKLPQDISVSLYCDGECNKTFTYSTVDDAENAYNVLCKTLDMIQGNIETWNELNKTEKYYTMFKFALGQVVFYIENNRTHSAPILSRMCVLKTYMTIGLVLKSKKLHGKRSKNHALSMSQFTGLILKVNCLIL